MRCIQFKLLTVVGIFLLMGKPGRAAELAIDHAAGAPRLQVKGEQGSGLQLLGATGITGHPWETLLDLTINDPVHTWLDTGGAQAAQRFYRLVKSDPTVTPLVAENFSLLDHTGKYHELYYHSDATAMVLVFCSVGGMDAATLAKLKSLRDAYESKGVVFWFINSNTPDTRASIAAEAASLAHGFPVLHDRAQLVAMQFGGPRNNEAVLVNPADWSVVYRGAIEDRAGQGAAAVVQSYLADALANLLAAKPGVIHLVKPATAALNLRAVPAASYAQDIAPLLLDKCVHCHSPGNIGPWAMTNHAVVQSYASLMKDNILEGHMPPWHADPEFGVFTNNFSLKPDDSAKLLRWLDDGAPRGDGPDPLAATPPPAVVDWPLGKPDYIVKIPAQSIPDSGVIDYRYLIVKSPVPTNAWLRAAAVRPGNRDNVHHALVFAGSTILDLIKAQGGLAGYFAGYVPGMDQVLYPAGTGKFLAKGSSFVFQMHYTTSGKAATDETELGLYLAPAPPALELKTGAAYNINFQIAPNDNESETQAEMTFAKSVWLYELSPHMHFRGSRFQFDAIYPDGTSETLLSVPHYHFHWQTLYRLTEPKRLPAGTRLVCKGAFDNSSRNPYNPDPTQTVEFGEQTFNEMFIGYVNYAEIP